MAGTDGPGPAAHTDLSRFASTIGNTFTLPRTPGWRMPLILVLAGLGAVLSYIAVDLAREVGAREVLLIVITVTLVVLGVWTRSTPWSLVALVLAVAAGLLGFQFHPDGDLDALHVGLGGLIQFNVAGMLLLVTGVLLVTEVVHARHARRGR